MKYRHLFFDLDHTLWDYNSNAKQTLAHLFQELDLKKLGVDSIDEFFDFLYHS